MKEEVEYKINLKLIFFLKILICISCFFLTILVSTRFRMQTVILGALLSLYLAILILLKKEITVFTNKKKLIISSILSCYIMKVFLSFYNVTINGISNIYNVNINICKSFFGILALPALIFFVYKFIEIIIPTIKKFLTNLTNVEKDYIKIIFIVSIILSFFTIYTTTAFTKPNDIDVIYTSDSLDLLIKDVYFNVSHNENDIRQPLFGIFALPFGVIAKIISEFIFFVPNDYAYEFVMTVLQFFITTITTILIARLLKIEEKDKKYLYILFSFSFPYIIFNLVLEQYVISLFYLILTIYLYYNYDGLNYAYIGATGSLITSGVLLPFVTKFKNIKQYIIDIAKIMFIFIAIFVIGGQFPQITYVNKTMTNLMSFAKPMPLTNKIYQFLNFVQGIFFSCKGEIIGHRYWLQEVDGISVVGIILLVIMVISAIMNRKEAMARISICWIAFSVFVLVIVGWGTTENGLILYSLYFSWAYLCLYYLFFEKIFKSRKIFITFILVTVLIMAIFNLREFLNILMFAIKYH